MEPKDNKVTYQKTFYDTNPEKVDKLANTFREQVIATHTQCNVCMDKAGVIWFFTTIFFKNKRW
jgi:hypothetical protein